MNVAALEAALPALTAALFTDVAAVGQVLVADEQPAVVRSDFCVLWRFLDDLPLAGAGGLGREMHGVRYVLEVRKGTSTQAARRAWPLELRAGLHHRRKPVTVTGLDHAEVLAVTVEPGEGVSVAGGAGAVLGRAEVLFVGDVLVGDEGA